VTVIQKLIHWKETSLPLFSVLWSRSSFKKSRSPADDHFAILQLPLGVTL